MRDIVNSYLPKVNTHLPRIRYVAFMARGKGAKPGPKKGSRKKASSRPMVLGFSDRLREAMGLRDLIEGGHPLNSELAKRAGCTHQAIGQYLNGRNTTMDAMLLLSICDALQVSPYYLAMNQGRIDEFKKGELPFGEIRKRRAPV